MPATLNDKISSPERKAQRWDDRAAAGTADGIPPLLRELKDSGPISTGVVRDGGVE